MNGWEFAVSGFQIYWEEVPVKDACSIMDDKAVDVLSTTSSELSDSLRDQILGKPYSRVRKPKSPLAIPLKSRPLYSQILSGTTTKQKSADPKLLTSSPQRIQTILEIEPNKFQNSSSTTTKPISAINQNLPKSTSDKTIESSKAKLISEDVKLASKTQDTNPEQSDTKISNTTRQIYYVAAETQTSDLSSAESAGEFVMDHKCKCCMWQTSCNLRNCGCDSSYDDDESTLVLDETTSQQFDEFSESTTQTSFCYDGSINRKGCCRCCCNQWDDELTDQSECICNYLDLPYQNNEEYMKLVRELEGKLVARNKERVRRTMREFEYRSRFNMNLEKPIFDEDEPILNKLSTVVGGNCPCCQPNTRVNSDIFQNERMWECHRLNLPGNGKPGAKLQSAGRSLKGSRWQLDPRSGEWVKISSFIEGDDGFPRSGGCSKMMPPKGPKLDGPSSYCRKEHCRRHGRF